MQLTAPKLIAGIISAIWGFTSLLGAPTALSQPSRTVPVAKDYIIEPTTTTSSTIYIDPYTSACEQFSALAVNLGWPADQRTVLESIMKRESNCTPNAVNRKDPFGGSRGLLQINGSWHKWLISKGVITRKQDLLQAQTNLLAGLEIYNYGVERYGFGWGPWSVK
jgi:soluble lytic murein transglycosylase-like protein